MNLDNLMINETIDECAAIADKYAAEEKQLALKFGKEKNPIAQATHAVLSVICERIAKDIRELKNENKGMVITGNAKRC